MNEDTSLTAIEIDIEEKTESNIPLRISETNTNKENVSKSENSKQTPNILENVPSPENDKKRKNTAVEESEPSEGITEKLVDEIIEQSLEKVENAKVQEDGKVSGAGTDEYKCDVCKKSFSKLEWLNYHI